ncbi:protein of unknown function (plasmid) [Cupriavidus taiwanensis]|uniref:Uncharacterized protein n=1 Tax=Cupriavidus taiwanensis TaxID=164546 RepID=A0A375ITA3_9BURK|nr:protein of unknown function [Cupriavidus taiwanensis]
MRHRHLATRAREAVVLAVAADHDGGALARHVRRHLAPDGARWVARFRFIDARDPLAISAWIGSSRRAR